MDRLLADWPYPVAVGVLFAIVTVRALATYWLGRAVLRGATRGTLGARLLASAAFRRGVRAVNRWGAPVVTVSFLTVGVQTAVNLAAGVARMSLRRYLPAVALGGLLWAFLYATVGFVSVAAWLRLWELSAPAAIVVLVGLGAALVVLLAQAVHHPVGANRDESEGELLLQRVPEGKQVKNRLHLDLNVGKDQSRSEVDRLAELGAVDGRNGESPGDTGSP